MAEHTQEQGLPVHHLANLGGLIAIAGLDREPPDFLLGVLISAAHEATALTAAQRARVTSLGHTKLEERATAKRAWRSWQRNRDLFSLTLSGEQLRRLIVALGGAAPANPDQVPVALMELLGGSGDATAEAAQR